MTQTIIIFAQLVNIATKIIVISNLDYNFVLSNRCLIISYSIRIYSN